MQTTLYLYRPVLKKALDITRKYKSLWFFGLFAVLVSAGGEYEIISRGLYNPGEDSIINAFVVSFQSGWQEGAKLTSSNFFQNFGQLLLKDSATVATTLFVLLFIITLTLFVVWLAVASQIALVKNASLAGKNKKATIIEGFEFANGNFWPVLIIVACLKIVLFVLFGILGWELWMLYGSGIWGSVLYVLSFIFFVVITLIIAFVFKYQTFYILLKRQKFIPALKSASRLFTGNWLISLEMALIMFGVYLLAAALCVFILTLFAGIPIVIIPIYLVALPAVLKWLISGVALVAMLALILLITAIMTTFQWAGWVALFERLEGGEEVSKLERISQGIAQLPSYMIGKK
jgi:hypothetical protein